jgi:siroheme synthase-like protein
VQNETEPLCFFPLFLPIHGKRVMIIGGGAVALRRVRTLLQFDCIVHVIAEEPCPELDALAAERETALKLERRCFSPGDCMKSPGDCVKDGRPVFVIAATNSRAVNSTVAQECAATDIPVSVADCKEESTFYFPAVAIHGTMVAGISSGGRDHGRVRDTASKIREALRNSADTNRDP